jgi:2-polyprenyl-6-methoxyphenol hydroxylase-like FAD-dependent oxidoreductase
VLTGTPEYPNVSIGIACVLGGSFAGLLAARVLADHAEQVLVIERDSLGDTPLARASVPQSRHGHFLQPEGLALLEGWFPGFTGQARVRGAVFSPPGHQRLYIDGEAVRFPEMTVLTASRPLLESEIRRRVRALPNVQVIKGRAIGLQYEGGAIRGVLYQEHDVAGRVTERMTTADITVDAMGRSSRLGHWLSGYGMHTMSAQRVEVGVSYATAEFGRPHNPREPAIATALHQFTSPPPGDHRPHAHEGRGLAGVAAYAIEDSRWQVVAMTYSGHQVPTTADDLRNLCASLPEIFRQATAGDLTGEAITFYYRDSRRRLITDPGRFPIGLVGIGDSVASFNPFHGQGMTSAAAQAAALAARLTGTGDPAAQLADFAEQQEKVVDQIWRGNGDS